ncbi:hypothetical protein [Peribacillus simplex]|uniref:hypothetical protein n=1 Tax=Peribacillus simplex TaxID=1478 RepID=UPI003D09488F
MDSSFDRFELIRKQKWNIDYLVYDMKVNPQKWNILFKIKGQQYYSWKAGINKLIKLKYKDLNQTIYSEYFEIAKNLNVKELFDDVNLDDLSVIDEIFDDFELDSKPNYQEDSSPDLVGNMTRNELRVEMTQAIKDAQSGLSKDMDSKEKIRSFFTGLFTSMGQDVAKYIILAVVQVLIAIMINIAASNHDYDVAKQVSAKINENETVKTVKKAFVKNPDIEQPIGEMAFLRTESKLRTRPSNKSHLASKEPVSKNTVIFPIETKGNWILVEVETKDDFYIGWVEESKVIKFTLEGK